jgi:predicted metal-dependent peptidase
MVTEDFNRYNASFIDELIFIASNVRAKIQYNRVSDVKNKLIDHLLVTGYPDYAAILYRITLDIIGLDSSPARIDRDCTCIQLSTRVFVRTTSNGKQVIRNNWLDIASLLIRHELLHRLLRHANRSRKLAKAYKYRLSSSMANISMDIEVSNYYSPDDVVTWNENPDIFYGGYNVYPDFDTERAASFPKFIGVPYEEVYAQLTSKEQDMFAQDKLDKSDKQSDTKDSENSNIEDSGNSDSGDCTDAKSEEQCEGNIDNKQDEKTSNSKNESKDQSEKANKPENQSEKVQHEPQDSYRDDLLMDDPDFVQNWMNDMYDDLPMYDKTIEKILESVETRKVQDMEINRVVGGPGAYIASMNTVVERDDLDENILKSSLQYDLNMFFGSSGRFVRHSTFSRPNKKYDGSDIIRRTRRMLPKDESKLVLYIDRSQSFNKEKTIAAESVFEKLRRIKNMSLEVFYFADVVVSEKEYNGRVRSNGTVVGAVSPGSGTDYSEVFQHINHNNFENVAIISDNDRCDRVLIPTCVKSLWYCYVREFGIFSKNACNAYTHRQIIPPCLTEGLRDPRKDLRLSLWTVDVIYYLSCKGTCSKNNVNSVINKIGTAYGGDWYAELIPELLKQVYYDTNVVKTK